MTQVDKKCQISQVWFPIITELLNNYSINLDLHIWPYQMETEGICSPSYHTIIFVTYHTESDFSCFTVTYIVFQSGRVLPMLEQTSLGIYTPVKPIMTPLFYSNSYSIGKVIPGRRAETCHNRTTPCKLQCV